MYKISVIIPVYNAELTLKKTINSVINQTIGFENIELILVDDNSSDNSKEIISDYANKYKNIVYFISDKNHGFPGFGRGFGTEIASSKYVMFIDNDDEFEIDMCKNLYDAIESYDCDIACCDIKEIDEISEEVHKVPINKDDEIILLYGDEIIENKTNWVWNKIFKKSIIDEFNISFLKETYCDDIAFCIEYMIHSQKMVYLNGYIGYFWMRRNESLSNSKKLSNLISIFPGYEYIVDLLIKNNKENLLPIISNSGTSFLLTQSSLLKSKKDRKEFMKLLYKFEEKCGFNVKLNNPFFSLVNSFVVKKRFTIAVLILSVYRKLNEVQFIKKLYRLSSFNKID